MRAGLVSITFRNLSVEEILDLVVEAKLDGIEWGGDVHVPHGDTDGAARVKRLTEEAGLQVSAYGSYYRFDDCLPNCDRNEPEWNEVLASAVALGAPLIRVWAGRLGSNSVSDDLRGRIVSRSREIALEAGRFGIGIGFEFHENTLTDSNEATLELLDEIGLENVSTFWQPYMSVEHSYRLDGLLNLSDRISNVHCNHFAKEGWPHSLMLEEGAEVWSEFLPALVKGDEHRWISIEHVKDHSVENFRKDAETLRRWLGD